MNNLPSKRFKLGFTLIELLVVIAIIAILAAILFPVFARARENARRASCQSNEKNIALGFKQYIQDNGEKYPPALVTAYGLKSSGGSGALSEYIKSSAIFYCPSDSEKNLGSYGYKLLNAENESAIQDTAGTVLLNETGTRHFEGMNAAYVDGHVKWSKGQVGTTTPVGSAAPTNGPDETGTLPAGMTFQSIRLNDATDATNTVCSASNPCFLPITGSDRYIRIRYTPDILSSGNHTVSHTETGDSRGCGIYDPSPGFYCYSTTPAIVTDIMTITIKSAGNPDYIRRFHIRFQ